MLELRDEHRRHTVERGAALAVDQFQNALWIERLHDTQAGAVRESPHHADDTAETMKQRHTQTQPVVAGVAEHLAARKAVVEDIAAREHDALREPGGARRVLHVDDGVGHDGPAKSVQVRLGGPRRVTGDVRVADNDDWIGRPGHGGQRRGGRLTDRDDPLQCRDRARGRANLAELGDIVDVAKAANRHQRRRFALAQQVVDVARAQRRVGGHQNRADLRQRELQHDPLGHVRRPDDDALAGRDAERDETARDRSRFLLELAEGPSWPLRVHDGVAIRQRAAEVRQEIAERDIAERRLAHRGADCILVRCA